MSRGTVNDISIESIIKKVMPDLIIYSGFGGEIVKNILSIGPRLLHIHSGYLPEYRGIPLCIIVF